MLPDAERLIMQARRGDNEALEKLLVACTPFLSKYIAARLPAFLRGVTSVEDIAQEVFVEAFMKIDRLRDTSAAAFTAWLKAIAQTSVMNAVKTHGRLKRGAAYRRVETGTDEEGMLVDYLDLLPADAATASRNLARAEAVAAIRVAIAGLPADQRMAVQLHLVRGQSLQQAAAAMGKTPTAVRGLVYRAKQQLALAMGRASAWLSSR